MSKKNHNPQNTVIEFPNMNEISIICEAAPLVIVDHNVFRLYPEIFHKNNHLIIHGEKEKDSSRLFSILKRLSELGLNRNDVLLSVGGGVTTDIGGFAASIFHRGIKSAYIPTTVTAITDASQGGKTAINNSGIKNVCGSYYFPDSIYINFNFLDTLSSSEIEDGITETVKHAVLSGSVFFTKLENFIFSKEWSDITTGNLLPSESAGFNEIAVDSYTYKQEIVAIDPFENGIRKILNLGHTVGHALETQSEMKLPHSRAVASGLIIELFILEKIFSADYSHFTEPLFKFFKNLNSVSLDNLLYEIALKDKKAVNKKIMISCPSFTDSANYTVECDKELFFDSVVRYNKKLKTKNI
ncbi:MAG: 3-dehydroquinate synthase [Deltaproteobacteria bacterium]|nr:3-dehydroquinate synthase [Deltaproteobacteria bacterium]